MFMIERLASAVDLRLRQFGPGPEKMFRGLLIAKIENNFVERVTICSEWFGLDLKSWGRFDEWHGLVEARNSWAHGHGRITRQQEARGARSKIVASGLTIVGDRIECTAGSARRAALCAGALVGLVDDSIRL
jgi:hypothetical protein